MSGNRLRVFELGNAEACGGFNGNGKSGTMLAALFRVPASILPLAKREKSAICWHDKAN
jgi:hypothetical protein